MNDKELWFELTAITLLLVIGVTLVMFSLPGWGLINIAGLLALLSFSLRLMNRRQAAESRSLA